MDAGSFPDSLVAVLPRLPQLSRLWLASCKDLPSSVIGAIASCSGLTCLHLLCDMRLPELSQLMRLQWLRLLDLQDEHRGVEMLQCTLQRKQGSGPRLSLVAADTAACLAQLLDALLPPAAVPMGTLALAGCRQNMTAFQGCSQQLAAVTELLLGHGECPGFEQGLASLLVTLPNLTYPILLAKGDGDATGELPACLVARRCMEMLSARLQPAHTAPGPYLSSLKALVLSEGNRLTRLQPALANATALKALDLKQCHGSSLTADDALLDSLPDLSIVMLPAGAASAGIKRALRRALARKQAA